MVARIPIRQAATGLPAVDRAFNELRDDIRQLLANPLSLATMIKVAAASKQPGFIAGQRALVAGFDTESFVLYPGTVNIVPHPLRAVPRGRIIVAQDSGAAIQDLDASLLSPSYDPAIYLALTPSMIVTCKVMVFLCRSTSSIWTSS